VTYTARQTPTKAKFGLLLIAIAFAALFGFATALVGPSKHFLIVLAFIPAIVMVFDYRIGIVLLMFLLPFDNSPHLPKLGSLNVPALLLLAVSSAFLFQAAARRFSARPLHVVLPKTLVVYYIVPVTLAAVIGSMHFNEITSFYRAVNKLDVYTLKTYWISIYFKPMLLVAMACVVASMV
jgi:hypothetical protein